MGGEGNWGIRGRSAAAVTKELQKKPRKRN